MIELGGNIKLVNFDDIEPGLLIVLKKLIGNYTKKISESLKDFKSIEVTLEDKEKNKIKVKIEADKTRETEAEDKNLFFALDKTLKEILK